MAEILVDSAGTIVVVMPDGHAWSETERNHEGWRIQVMFGPVEHYEPFAGRDSRGRRAYRMEGDQFRVMEYPEDAANLAAWNAMLDRLRAQ